MKLVGLSSSDGKEQDGSEILLERSSKTAEGEKQSRMLKLVYEELDLLEDEVPRSGEFCSRNREFVESLQRWMEERGELTQKQVDAVGNVWSAMGKWRERG